MSREQAEIFAEYFNDDEIAELVLNAKTEEDKTKRYQLMLEVYNLED